jgi:hypothetical protein
LQLRKLKSPRVCLGVKSGECGIEPKTPKYSLEP